MLKKPKYLISLVLLWILFGAIFLGLGISSLTLTIWIFSSEYNALIMPNWVTPMIFFMTFTETTTLLVFGCIFAIFAYETYQCKSWVWNAGIIVSTIFIVIFSFLLASLMLTALLFTDEFSVQTLITIMLTFLVDLGIIFLLTRPHIKIYFEKQKTNGSD